MQASWTTDIEEFSTFKHLVERHPQSAFLYGCRPCFPNALTAAAIAEERSIFWVNSPAGWRARISVRSRSDIADALRARCSDETRKSRRWRQSIPMMIAILEREIRPSRR